MTELPYTKVFVRDLQIPMSIGIYAHERDKKQNVLMNIEVWETSSDVNGTRSVENVIDYDVLRNVPKDIAESGHIDYVETFVEHVADEYLKDRRIAAVRIKAEKTEIFDDAESGGIEIFRTRA